jgi:hypothetical protein
VFFSVRCLLFLEMWNCLRLLCAYP